MNNYKGISLSITIGKFTKPRPLFDFQRTHYRIVWAWFAVAIYRFDLDSVSDDSLEELLPAPADLRGLSPDFTGNKSSEDYVRELRR